MLSSMCQHAARLQFDSCAEKHSLFGTVMVAWNLTCSGQCHGVSSHGTSSRFAQESLPTEAGLCRHQCFSVVGQATQDSPKASPRKNFIKQLYKAIAQMNAD